MKIAIINTNRALASDGPRLLSSILRANGHNVSVFFTGAKRDHASKRQYFELRPLHYSYSDEMLYKLLNEISDFDVIMISTMSNYSLNAFRVADFLKGKSNARVVIGGIHATVKPEECLEHADIVGLGECEEAVVDLISRLESGTEDYFSTENFWFKKDNVIIKNKIRPLVMQLDDLPMSDFSFKDHYYWYKDRFLTEKEDIIALLMFGYPLYTDEKNNYTIMTTRGCPHMCSYCYQSLFYGIYNTRKIRKMSVERIIDELVWVKENSTFIQKVYFGDDDFFVRNLGELQKFAKLYKERIGMEFTCCGSANTISKEKLDILVDAGLTILLMGIQTGSKRLLQDVYNRNISRDKVLKVAKIVNTKIKNSNLRVSYDFIVNNPYENDNDIKESISLILQIPRPYSAAIYSLTFYPGTPMYDMALADNLISRDPRTYASDFRAWINHKDLRYLTIVQGVLLRGKLPDMIIKILSVQPFVAIGNVVVKLFPPYKIKATLRKMKRLIK